MKNKEYIFNVRLLPANTLYKSDLFDVSVRALDYTKALEMVEQIVFNEVMSVEKEIYKSDDPATGHMWSEPVITLSRINA